MRPALLPALLVTLTTAATAQTPLSFEVASIKRNPSLGNFMSFGLQPGGRLTMVNNTTASIIGFAYPTEVPGLVGAPPWVTSDRFDVTARAPTSDPTQDDLRQMVQTFLAERFKLAVHYETTEQPVYALVVARPDGRLGPQLTPSSLDCEAVQAAGRAGRPANVPLPANGAPPCGMRGERSTRAYSATPLSSFATSIGGLAGRRVIDKTGLSGRFDITLNAVSSSTPPQPDDPPTIFTALQEQLGLKLQPDRAMLKSLLIDHIERPIED